MRHITHELQGSRHVGPRSHKAKHEEPGRRREKQESQMWPNPLWGVLVSMGERSLGQCGRRLTMLAARTGSALTPPRAEANTSASDQAPSPTPAKHNPPVRCPAPPCVPGRRAPGHAGGRFEQSSLALVGSGPTPTVPTAAHPAGLALAPAVPPAFGPVGVAGPGRQPPSACSHFRACAPQRE